MSSSNSPSQSSNSFIDAKPLAYALPPEFDASSADLPAIPSTPQPAAIEAQLAGEATPTKLKSAEEREFRTPVVAREDSAIESKGKELTTEATAEGRGTELTLVEETTEKRPEWLPDGLVIIKKRRMSGASAGTIDKYYVHVATGKMLRSKLEVLRFIETGSAKKKSRPLFDAEPPPDQAEEKKALTAAAEEWKPESVTWELPGPNSTDEPIPFVDGVEVPLQIRRAWAEEFERRLNKSKRQKRKRDEGSDSVVHGGHQLRRRIDHTMVNDITFVI